MKFTYEDFFRQQSDQVDETDKNKDGTDPVDEEEEKRLKEENKKQVITSMKGTAMKMKQAKKQQQSSKRPAVKTWKWPYRLYYIYSNNLTDVKFYVL